jgi:hypothetical protein
VPVRAVGMTGCPKSLALMCVAMPTGIVPIGATVSQPARESRPISSTDLPLLLTDGRESVDSSERRRDRFVLEVLLRRTVATGSRTPTNERCIPRESTRGSGVTTSRVQIGPCRALLCGSVGMSLPSCKHRGVERSRRGRGYMELEQHIQRGRAHRKLGALLLLVRHVPASANDYCSEIRLCECGHSVRMRACWGMGVG